MGKRKGKRRIQKRKAFQVMIQRARWMRQGAATIHEQLAKNIIDQVCTAQGYTARNQYVFYDECKRRWYIVDFFIPKLGLIIEIDGASHNGRQEYDAKRTEFLEWIGNKVVRFKNEELLDLEFRGKIERLFCSTDI